MLDTHTYHEAYDHIFDYYLHHNPHFGGNFSENMHASTSHLKRCCHDIQNIWEGSIGKQRVTEMFEIFSRYWRVVLPASGSLLLASLTGGLSGDLFNLLITRELGWESSKLSIIYFLMLLSVPIQMLGPSLARQAGYRKMMSTGVTVMLICLVIMLFAVWYPASKFHQLFLLGMCAVVVEIAYSLSFGTVWSAWISEIVSREKRPGVMAITSIISQCSMIDHRICHTDSYFSRAGIENFLLCISHSHYRIHNKCTHRDQGTANGRRDA
ncbi:MFS transporter [Corynebacterium silvaticum]|uniref:MFS transporter n=2 Tax=Corynebacterium silvaticum TaxID=2320431 RepID=UPI001068BD01|nr:MFS transporter [Corynebacterium silvaticum]NOM65640.1 MFS transporter [Corynebacterium silvaticum]NON70409.1 MFS transporter [Corynebacterium silvaticum]UWH02793.1 MFS transporter [Corynebacterium silvaticum]UXZ31074.1 MFS transporter [Corynebacterium silvaticum]